MLDIDYCNGKNCPLCNICQRYSDYLFKIKLKQDVSRTKNGTSNCLQFKPKVFIGN